MTSGLNIAHACYFAILERTSGVGVGIAPGLMCPLIAIEFRNKDERKALYVLDPVIPDLTTFDYLGRILTFPGQVKQEMLRFSA